LYRCSSFLRCSEDDGVMQAGADHANRSKKVPGEGPQIVSFNSALNKDRVELRR
jgi:hypothetical protein